MSLARQAFTRTGNPPDPANLATAIRPTIGDPFYVRTQVDNGSVVVVVEKPTAWLAAEITAVQTAVTACVDRTPETDAQSWIDQLPIGEKAILLTLLDQINTIRAALPAPLGAITPAQAIAAVRAKAATL